MSHNESINNLINSFHAGEIPEEDFQKLLETDPELQQEFELYQKDLTVIQASAKAQLKNKAAMDLEEFERQRPTIFPLKRVLLLAAAVVLLIVSFFLYQKYGQVKTAPELYAAYFELLPPANERSGSEPSDVWQAAMKTYANGDYNKTIELLAPALHNADFQHAESGKLYLGLSYMMVNENQKAIDVLNDISAESSYLQDAVWYKALAYLKMNQVVEAKAALQKIAEEPRHFKQAEALKLMEEI